MVIMPRPPGVSTRLLPPPLPAERPGMCIVSVDDPNALAPFLVMNRRAPGFDRIQDGRAVNREGAPVQECLTRTFRQAFDDEHDRDLHFVMYNAIGHDSVFAQKCPRLTKPGLYGFIHEYRLAHSVVGCALGLDYDLPNHQPWSPAILPMIEDMLAAAGERNPIFKYPTVCYRTKGGFRLVWALTDPIKPEGRDGLEDHLRGLIGDAYIAGLPVDAACRDWTRHLRLPRVQRQDDGSNVSTQTSAQSYFSISYNRCDLRALDDCPDHVVAYAPCFVAGSLLRGIHQHTPAEYQQSEVAKKLFTTGKWESYVGHDPYEGTTAAANVDVGASPTLTEAGAMLRIGASRKNTKEFGRLRQQFWNWGQRTGTSVMNVWRVIDEGRPIFAHPEAMEGLHEGIQQAVSLLTRFMVNEGVGSPQHVFAFVIEHAWKASEQRRLAGRASRTVAEIEHEVWDLVSRFWRNDVAKKLAYDQEKADAAERAELEQRALSESAEYAVQRVKAQFSEWAGETKLSDVELDNLTLHGLLIEVKGQGYFTLSICGDGSLSYKGPVDHLGETLNFIRDSRLTSLLNPFKGRDRDGNAIIKTAADLRTYSTLTIDADRVICDRTVSGHRLSISRDRKGDLQFGFVRYLLGMDPGGEVQYWPEIAEFFHFLGGDREEDLLDYLACFRHIERPLAALEIAGACSVGKHMTVKALAQLTESKTAADFNALYTDNGFADGWLKTPLLWADEEIVMKGRRAINDVKKVVTGELDKINRKGVAAVQVVGFYRLVMTTNDEHMVEHNETTNQNDLNALSLRILHIKATKECADYLERIGNWKATHDWVTKKIPEHIRWLEQTRYDDVLTRQGKRLLVEGKPADVNDETLSLVANNPRANLTLRAIGKILAGEFDPATGYTRNAKYPDIAMIDVAANLLLVRSEALVELINATSSERNKPTHRDVNRILRKWYPSKPRLRRRMPKANVKNGFHTPNLFALKLSEMIEQLSLASSGDDFRGNGILTDDYYREHLPAIYESLTAPDVLASGGAPAPVVAPPAPAPAPLAAAQGGFPAPGPTIAPAAALTTSNTARPRWRYAGRKP